MSNGHIESGFVLQNHRWWQEIITICFFAKPPHCDIFVLTSLYLYLILIPGILLSCKAMIEGKTWYLKLGPNLVLSFQRT